MENEMERNRRIFIKRRINEILESKEGNYMLWSDKAKKLVLEKIREFGGDNKSIIEDYLITELTAARLPSSLEKLRRLSCAFNFVEFLKKDRIIKELKGLKNYYMKNCLYDYNRRIFHFYSVYNKDISPFFCHFKQITDSLDKKLFHLFLNEMSSKTFNNYILANRKFVDNRTHISALENDISHLAEDFKDYSIHNNENKTSFNRSLMKIVNATNYEYTKELEQYLSDFSPEIKDSRIKIDEDIRRSYS